MADWLARVRDWYDRDPEAEWLRLDGRVQNRIERLVAWHAIGRHLPPPTRDVHVLDAGGGPGRYTFDLAERGYTTTLLDLSPANVAFARRQATAAAPNVLAGIAACVEGSFTDLSCFADGAFDAVICLGAAFSHIVEANARRQALAEFTRVVRPGGVLLIAALNRIGAYRAAVQWPDSWEPTFADGGAEFIETGYSDAGGWPCYSFMPEEFSATLAEAALELLALYGAQGIAAHLPPDRLEALLADPARWPLWRELLLRTCDHPNVVGVSAQLIAAVRAR